MPQSPAERVAGEVRAELARQRKTQSDLAAATGMSQQAVSRRLAGQVPFDIAELHSVAEFLGVAVSALMPEVAA